MPRGDDRAQFRIALLVTVAERATFGGIVEDLLQEPGEVGCGMRQRIVIALALAAEPRFVIADEPTTALDVSIQAQILGLLRRLSTERRMSMLLITHDFGVIAEMADRVAVMYKGKLVEEGPVRQILRAPQHEYTKNLLAAVPGMRGGER